MATVLKRKKRQVVRESGEVAVSGKHEQDKEGSRTPAWASRRTWLISGGVALVLFIWFLPSLVAHTPLLNWIVRSAASDLNGTVAARSASLGWFSPVRLYDLEVRDEGGESLLELSRMEVDRTLLAILWDSSDLGHVRLDGPAFNIVLRADGSNVEDALAEYMAPSEESDARNLALEILDGTVSITDAHSNRAWKVENLQLSMKLPADVTRPLELEASGEVADQDRPGRFSVELKTHLGNARQPDPPDDSSDDNSNEPAGNKQAGTELVIQTEGVPLEMFERLTGRFTSLTALAGRVSSSMRFRRDGRDGSPAMDVQGEASFDALSLAAPLLGTDELAFSQLHATCGVAWRDDRIKVDRLALESEICNASLVGVLDLNNRSATDISGLLRNQALKAEGRIDLARLATMLPNTLRIREGTQITSGELQLSLTGQPGPEETTWQGQVEARDLRAVNRGQELSWQQPILVTLSAGDGPNGLVLRDLHCESDFVTLDASGTPNDLTASARFDLRRLAGQLGQFVDLGELRLAGDGSANFNWQRREQYDFQADGRLQVGNFELATTDRPSWTEQSLIVTLSASGQTDLSGDTRLTAATARFDAGTDWLQARLTQPVLDFHAGGDWPVEVRSQGQLAGWEPRLAPWLAIGDYSLAGFYDLVGQASASAGAIRVREVRLAVQQLHLQGPDVNVIEPRSEIALSGSWDRDDQRLELKSASLTTSGISARTDDLVCRFSNGLPAELTGAVNYRGDLDRLQDWIVDPADPPQWHVLGRFSGSADFRQAEGITAARFDTMLHDFMATHKSGNQFREKQVHLAGSASYDPQTGLLDLEQTAIDASTIGLAAAGQVALGDDLTNLNLTGKIDYDVAGICQFLEPFVGQGVSFVGRGSTPASYQGPLAVDAARAAAGLGWKQGNVYGFQLGPGELQAAMSGGIVQFKPLELDVSEGRMKLAPTLHLASPPSRTIELHVQPGKVADQIRINPRMCANALQYLAPVLAGVATAEGRFSIELAGCRVPVCEPSKGELAGRMIIDTARVGPGPLVRELALVLGRASSVEIAQNSVVKFRMVEGRVYHEGLELVFPDLTVRTYGSVGLDQTLAIMAEMPVPPKWRPGHEVLESALRNQTIRLPIGGTLQKPTIDRKVLDRLSQQFIENAARNVLQDQLNQGLQRLLGPQR